MRFVADLHIHSHYSISTSPQLTPELLDLWAAIKGLAVIGTGDFTHPGWLSELEAKLVPAEQGLYRLRPELRREAKAKAEAEGLPVRDSETRFLLSAEISNIYRRGERTRKVHNLILASDFAAARRLQRQLDKRGNITSDGRPILGMDSRDLLEVTLEVCPEAVFVPAHIWTPWFSALGEKSGFDRISECYADLASHIRAVETGLSSDPPMNWLCSFLDRYTLISNSDAHSPEKLGREANLFDTELSYPAIASAVQGETGGLLGTVEFFPQEGKYHYDGHRKCRVCWSPLDTLRGRGLCPMCGKPLTIGVLNRVAQLADRDRLPDPSSRRRFHSLIPLKEILSEILGVGPGSRQIAREYLELVRRAGSEFAVLLELSIPEVENLGGELLGEAIRRMRAAEVQVEPGFDGEYGTVHLFAPGESLSYGVQELPFQPSTAAAARPAEDAVPSAAGAAAPPPLVSFDIGAYRRLRDRLDVEEDEAAKGPGVPFPGAILVGKDRSPERPRSLAAATAAGAATDSAAAFRGSLFQGLTDAQTAAAVHSGGAALVLAGPGTGKTRALAARIAWLVSRQGVAPDRILAVTFTNRAAREMRSRLRQLTGCVDREPGITVSTFHALGRLLLAEFLPDTGREANFPILDQDDRTRLLVRLQSLSETEAVRAAAMISTAKQHLHTPESVEDPQLQELYRGYQDRLAALQVFDLDDLLYEPVLRLSADSSLADRLRERYPWVLVDEYQDVNEAQYRLVRLLAPEASANLWAVGDPNQAIYAFRGADVRFIRRFLDDYPGATVYRLSESFRCSDTILQASGQVLGMPGSVERDGTGSLTSSAASTTAVRIRISEYPTAASEAEAVARTIEAMMGGLRFFSMDSDLSEGREAEGIESLADFAVLCRIGRQMAPLERAFKDHSIPYQKAEADPFWKLEPARSLLGLARVLRLRHKGREARELFPGLSEAGWSSLEALAAEPVHSVEELLSRLVELRPPQNLDAPEREETLARLLEYSRSFGADLDGFLAQTVLGTGADGVRRGDMGTGDASELVSLLTLHAAKGLEYTCVFVVGCEDGLLPYSLLPGHSGDREEERRLFYVGMTRARRYLFLSHARRRRLFGRELTLRRSPFVDAIERELIDLERPEIRHRTGKSEGQLELF